MEEEIWKPIKDYEGLYEVSNLGRVKSLNYKGTGKGKILKNIVLAADSPLLWGVPSVKIQCLELEVF